MVNKGRNPNAGRHGVGSPVGKFTPNRPSTGASGNYGVGTGRNQKTAGRANYQGTAPRSGTDSQPESFVNQAPSPWDNSQPSSNPSTGAPATNPTAGGTWNQLTSQPGNHPKRSPGSPVPTDPNTPTGHKKGYKPAGQAGRSVISGQPLAAKGTKNTDNAGQPISQAQAKFNRDFAAAYEQYKKWGG